LREQREHCERRADLQRRVAASAGELEHLRDELDLADASRPELDLIGELPARHFLADLRVQLAQSPRTRRSRGICGNERAHDRGERVVLTIGPSARALIQA